MGGSVSFAGQCTIKNKPIHRNLANNEGISVNLPIGTSSNFVGILHLA